MDEFNFTLGDVVLAEWEDKLFYAKIDRIDWSQSKCVLIFDDDSVEECPFTKIHSVTETTAEIVCIICKDGRSSRPNEIVLCDKCGIGYHQRCHQPNIPASALEFDAPWMCVYCSVGALCPYLENPFESKTKKTVSRKRRLTSSIKTDGFASSGNSTEDEGLLTSQKLTGVSHRRGMSRFYFTSHREGPKPRGRPTFGHKVKVVGERRGRDNSSGRTVARSTVRDNFESHSEREYCFDSEETKMPSHHLQRQSEDLTKNQRRCTYPAKRVAKVEDYTLATTRKAHDSVERTFSPMESDLPGGKVARNNNSRPREAPREKQRLTQDLARQKRLLSEDIARAELLQRDQILKKFTEIHGNGSEGTCAEDESSHDPVLSDSSVSGNAESPSRERNLLDGHDKCPGPFEKCSEEHLSANEQGVLKDQSIHPAPGDKRNEKERESLFEKFSCKGDTRSAEFVSSDNVEVGGENNSLPNCEAIKTLNSSSNSSEGEKVSCGGDLVTGHLEPLEFENVTDDDLDISDVEPQSPLVSGSDKTPVELDLGDPKKQKNEIKKSSLPEMCPDIGTSVMDSAVDCTESPQSETNIFESLSLSPCSCQSELESAERVTTASGCHESSNAPESPGLGNSGKHPDHSNIKMDQVMVQPDMQCEHSTKCESVSEHVIASSVNLECGGPVAEELSNCYDRKDRDAANASPEAARAKEENLENGEPLEWSHSDEEEDNETAKTVANKDRLSPANGEQNDAVLSNNEGMSDAGEMSEPEIAAGVARGKVKTKKRKRSHSVAKLHIRGNHRPRGNRNRRARTLKGSRRNNFKGLESGSDDNEAYVTTADCTARETEVNTKGEGDRAVPSTTCCDTERTEEDEGEEQIEGDAPTEASAEVHEEVEKERVSSSVVDNSDDDVEVHGNGELSKKDRIKRENRLVIKHKRKSEEKDKDRATPPHLVSQNRYARDLPRHNWLVEQLLQQNKLCGDTINNIAIPDKRDTQEKLSESEEIEGEKTEKSEKRSCEVELGSKSDTVGSSGEQNEAQLSPTKDAVHSELHKNFFKRCPQQTVPRAPPKLKPSTETSFDGASPVLKHKLSPRETPILEPLPKLKKIVEGDQSPKQELNAERQGAPTEAESADSEERNSHPELEELKMRKALSPIEILDDDEDKRERALEPGVNLELQSPSAKKAQDDNEEEPSRNNGLPEPSRSKSFSPPRKPAVLSLAKGRGNSVSPKDHLGRSLHTSPHRAAILIPVVPMQDGMHRGLASSSPRLKGFPPRTFTPHLLTHTSPLSASPMFPDALPPGVRYPGNACVHQHMGGGHCKRDINCPFHGNQGRGIPPSPLSISGHRPITGFSQHGHELLSRNHHHDDAKSPCTHAECKTCHFDKDANMALFNDKGPGELPKVVKPIAHVPGKRAPLILPHLPQHGRLSHAPYRGLEELYEESPRGIGAESAGFQSRRKSADKLTTSHSGSDIAPSHMHPPPLTLSELNRRREEENAKAYGEETQVGFQSKLSPQSDLNVPGIAPLSRNVNGRPRSKDGLVLSAGHHGPIVVSRSDQRRSPRPLSLGIGEQAERLDYSSYMAELLKSGPPRLRPVEDPQELTDYKSLVNRHKQEELLVLNSDKPRFAQPMLVKDSSEALTDGKRSARDFDEREKSMRRIPGDGRSPNLRLLGSRGGTGMLEVRPSDSESVGTKDGKQRQHSQEIERGRHKSDTAFNRGFGPRGFELVQSKDQTKRGDSRAGIDTEREFSVSSAQSGSPKEVDPREHSLLPPRISQRFDPRLDSRIAALREMELHRRLENNRLSDFSHREMLSRMALSFSLDKPKPAEQSSHDAALIRHDLRSRVFSNPTTRDYVMPASSRQALDRLAAAAGKPGSLTAESRLKQEMERERERHHHQMSVEHYDANRRLLHAELKDKVNPLVFSKETAIRGERDRELEDMRLREKMKIEHDKVIAADSFTDGRKRKRPDEGDLSLAMASGPSGRPSLDREEYERLKRMRLLPTTPTSSLAPGYHRCAPNRPFHVEIKGKDEHMAKHHPMSLPQRRFEGDSERYRMRLARPNDLDLEIKNDGLLMVDRGAVWLRERERVLQAQELGRNSLPLHGGARMLRAFHASKSSATPSSSGKEKRKPDDESTNRCCVCKRDASFLCSGCQAAWYCSSDCQLSAWASHSQECGQSQKR